MHLLPRKHPLPIILLVLGVVALGGFFAARPLAWMLVRSAVRRKFPDVRQLPTATLAGWLNDPSRPAPVLLDARSAAEYGVSHLPGARRVDFEGDVAGQLAGVVKDRPVVVYCSVGYRSSIFAGKLRRAGFRDVENLEGSIFQWVNEGRPLADGAGTVHPYNTAWGWLVKPAARAKPPAALP